MPTTRQLLIEVAQREISERGFNGVSLRSIARRADVDPSLVRHYFGSKQNLLAQAVQMEVDPGALAAEILPGSPATVGQRTVRVLLSYWDNSETAPMALAQLAATLGHAEVGQPSQDPFIMAVLGPIAEAVSPDYPQLRAALAGSQLIALAFSRYLVGDPVLAACRQPELIRVLGRTVQRYLTEPLPVDATGRDRSRSAGTARSGGTSGTGSSSIQTLCSPRSPSASRR